MARILASLLFTVFACSRADKRSTAATLQDDAVLIEEAEKAQDESCKSSNMAPTTPATTAECEQIEWHPLILVRKEEGKEYKCTCRNTDCDKNAKVWMTMEGEEKTDCGFYLEVLGKEGEDIKVKSPNGGVKKRTAKLLQDSGQKALTMNIPPFDLKTECSSGQSPDVECKSSETECCCSMDCPCGDEDTEVMLAKEADIGYIQDVRTDPYVYLGPPGSPQLKALLTNIQEKEIIGKVEYDQCGRGNMAACREQMRKYEKEELLQVVFHIVTQCPQAPCPTQTVHVKTKFDKFKKKEL